MASKYLDGAGLDHMWDKMKAYLGNNYAVKSHTHTASQITDLSVAITSVRQVDTTIDTSVSGDISYTIPSMAIKEILTIRINIPKLSSGSASKDYHIYLPSGGTYFLLDFGLAYSGGAQIASNLITSYSDVAAVFLLYRAS